MILKAVLVYFLALNGESANILPWLNGSFGREGLGKDFRWVRRQYILGSKNF